ncbi:unnamed protein product [Onchocerca flexuosa]|uniref:Uncharacterized protein n=1 Tax=Onchocerca flexuosa TaxID=387005 RepID=A0A183I1M2_9BILA|nr:unnamed protein product [Onchocerca flexuosa]
MWNEIVIIYYHSIWRPEEISWIQRYWNLNMLSWYW